jgi:hypothetical protein
VLGAIVTGRLVGHEEKPYESFTDKQGRLVPAGISHHVVLADPETGRHGRFKCSEAIAAELRSAWWGGCVTVETRVFGQTVSLVKVLAVQDPLAGVLDPAPATSARK